MIRALHREREQALATLKKHGLPVNKNINVSLHHDPKEKSYILILYIFTLNVPFDLLMTFIFIVSMKFLIMTVYFEVLNSNLKNIKNIN